MHPFGSAVTMAIQEENMANKTQYFASEQNDAIIELGRNYDSLRGETYNLDIPGSFSNYQKEMERYLMECIKHHQKLIECVICRVYILFNCRKCVIFISQSLKIVTFPYRCSEKIDLLWKRVFFYQFLTASLLICFIGLRAISVSKTTFV